MRTILLAVFMMIASLPVEASPCDMHQPGDMSHSTHNDMTDNTPMNMDCCDHEGSDTPDSCDPLKHCGASANSFLAIGVSPVSVAFIATHETIASKPGTALKRYQPPPLRPPIT